MNAGNSPGLRAAGTALCMHNAWHNRNPDGNWLDYGFANPGPLLVTGLFLAQIQYRHVQNIEAEDEQAGPTHGFEHLIFRLVEQADDGDAGHHDGR